MPPELNREFLHQLVEEHLRVRGDDFETAPTCYWLREYQRLVSDADVDGLQRSLSRSPIGERAAPVLRSEGTLVLRLRMLALARRVSQAAASGIDDGKSWTSVLEYLRQRALQDEVLNLYPEAFLEFKQALWMLVDDEAWSARMEAETDTLVPVLHALFRFCTPIRVVSGKSTDEDSATAGSETLAVHEVRVSQLEAIARYLALFCGRDQTERGRSSGADVSTIRPPATPKTNDSEAAVPSDDAEPKSTLLCRDALRLSFDGVRRSLQYAEKLVRDAGDRNAVLQQCALLETFGAPLPSTFSRAAAEYARSRGTEWQRTRSLLARGDYEALLRKVPIAGHSTDGSSGTCYVHFALAYLAAEKSRSLADCRKYLAPMTQRAPALLPPLQRLMCAVVFDDQPMTSPLAGARDARQREALHDAMASALCSLSNPHTAALTEWLLLGLAARRRWLSGNRVRADATLAHEQHLALEMLEAGDVMDMELGALCETDPVHQAALTRFLRQLVGEAVEESPRAMELPTAAAVAAAATTVPEEAEEVDQQVVTQVMDVLAVSRAEAILLIQQHAQMDPSGRPPAAQEIIDRHLS
ncbi:hypothetical protein CDCA_CDCA07G2140 [Cyanidium caldarium]|uniref:Uncharacterized protein n=1 Tax=Cyanidium caldarium TaxID=2771 RepID=A0AAV9IVJ1_CYACA|nr:hypothetical protein CDCA_CDCA07G2140 [Cyanidium caldarium]